jgi:hypothetical protein
MYHIFDFAAFLSKYGNSGRGRMPQTEEPARDGRQQPQSDRDRQPRSSQSRIVYDRSRTVYRGRNREYSLRESEVRTLVDFGKFRMVPDDDLARFAYRGDRWRMKSDLRDLAKQGLIEQRKIQGHSSY